MRSSGSIFSNWVVYRKLTLSLPDDENDERDDEENQEKGNTDEHFRRHADNRETRKKTKDGRR